MNGRRLWAIMQKEIRQLRRDRITLAMIMLMPILQLVLFGYAINLNLRGLDAAIADQAQTSASRALVMDMLATGVIRPVADARTPEDVVDLIRRGRINVGVVIPPDFEARKLDGRPVALTSLEYRLLAYLMHRPGHVVSRTELTEHLYAQDFDRDSNTIEVFIARLRRKLPPDTIETVRGLGYRLAGAAA